MTNDLPKLLGIDFAAFDFEGTTYRMRELDLVGMARLSTWLEKRAVEAVERLASEMSDTVARALRRDLIADIAAGVYAPGGEAYAKAMFTRDGQAYIVFLSLSADHPDIDFPTAQRIVAAKWEEIAARLPEVCPGPGKSSGAPAGSPIGAP